MFAIFGHHSLLISYKNNPKHKNKTEVGTYVIDKNLNKSETLCQVDSSETGAPTTTASANLLV